MSSNKTALITGASTGIGKQFAHIHAERGGNLIVVARSEDKLQTLASELKDKHGIDVYVIAKDLSNLSAAKEVYDEIHAQGLSVDYLINNAGFGGQGYFHERNWEQDLAMINLNVTALTALTRYFINDMVERKSGKILNVSSTASLLAGPLQAVYFATKAYVTSFSNALSRELSDKNITVTALLPGATETEFAETSGMDKTSMFEQTFSAFDVAKAGYEGMLEGKLDVLAGVNFQQRIMFNMIPFAPKKMLLDQVFDMQKTI